METYPQGAVIGKGCKHLVEFRFLKEDRQWSTAASGSTTPIADTKIACEVARVASASSAD
jgi:hypothetical protein